MKILVTGANGQLGRELLRQAPNLDFEVLAADLPDIDISESASVSQWMQTRRPDLLVNAAAYTHVDNAESQTDLAFKVNSDGPAILAEACRHCAIPLVHVSTDYVFDGLNDRPYRESDPTSPVGVYGRSKAAGEKRVRDSLSRHIILRTAWLYGVYGHNFVKTMLRLGREKRTLSIVDDQFGSPTCAEDLAATILSIAARIRQGADISWGTYHYCGRGVTTWYRFAQQIFKIAESLGMISTPSLRPVTTAEYPTVAKRPPYSAMDCDRIQTAFDILFLPWRERLEATLRRIREHGDDQ